MPIAFIIDENLSPEIAVIARRQFAVDIVAGIALRGVRTTDTEQLARAAAAGRCIVTADRGDFWNLSIRVAAEGRPRAGVLLVPQPPGREQFQRVAEGIGLFARMYPDGVPPYFTAYLPRL